jgi:hypothetical protein
MCAKFFYLILAAFFVFVVSTVAAFVYLEWWQAILASAAVFILLIIGAKVLIQSAFGNLKKMAQGMMDEKSKTLRNASIEVHSVKTVKMPSEIEEEMRQVIDGNNPDGDEDDEEEEPPQQDYANFHWVEVELTLFTDADEQGKISGWDVSDLRIVPIDAKPIEFMSMDDEESAEFDLYEIHIVKESVASVWQGDTLHGPQRIRFTTGVPRGTRLVKMQYYFEHFGRIELPPSIGLPPAKTR